MLVEKVKAESRVHQLVTLTSYEDESCPSHRCCCPDFFFATSLLFMLPVKKKKKTLGRPLDFLVNVLCCISVQNSERGKKIGNAMITTSRSVVQTGKAVGQSVGGALTSAKSAMSSWFSTLAQPAAVTSPTSPEPATEDAILDRKVVILTVQSISTVRQSLPVLLIKTRISQQAASCLTTCFSLLQFVLLIASCETLKMLSLGLRYECIVNSDSQNIFLTDAFNVFERKRGLLLWWQRKAGQKCTHVLSDNDSAASQGHMNPATSGVALARGQQKFTPSDPARHTEGPRSQGGGLSGEGGEMLGDRTRGRPLLNPSPPLTCFPVSPPTRSRKNHGPCSSRLQGL
ncbi:hypothetical protein INR49_012142 [Caranx melampygus]|nr:hypothetical protein INR49_012142 [Caranx melampygus]